MSKSIDQQTDVDKRIRDFVDRKSSPFYTIMERLANSMTNRTVKSKDIGYEALQWKHVSRQQ